MLRRFVSGCAIASILIVVALLGVVLTHTLTVPRAYPLATLWCFAPFFWGVWAMLAPSSWVPRRLPIWGAILGLGAGFFAHFVINMPLKLFGVTLSAAWRGGLVLVMVGMYFFFWILVRAVYRSLSEPAASS